MGENIRPLIEPHNPLGSKAQLGGSERERGSEVDVLFSALAALAKEIPTLANMLAKPSLERDREFLLSLVLHRFLNNTTEIYFRHFPVTLEPPALVNILGFTKSRSVNVQLASCL